MFAFLFQTAPAPSGFDFPLVAALTAFIALPVKFLVDTVKGALPNAPSAVLPIAGIGIGYVFCIVVLIASKTPFDGAVFAQCGIAAVGAQIAASAATWNQSRAEKVDERIQAGIDAAPGTTKAQVDNAVFSK